MNNQKIAGIPGLIGLLMIVSTHSWAKPCTKMIETVQGTEMYMSCHYLKIIAVILGIGLMAISVEGILEQVYRALKEKGYNPVNQIVGYIMSGDPTYITSHKGARSMIMKVERDELVEELLTEYIKNKSWER